MLWYIIDGWNVIHKITSLRNNSSPKEEFISFIKRYRLTGSSNNRVTVVFDGRADLLLKNREHRFEIIFSGTNSADDLICKKVDVCRNKRQIVVVTDDYEIINYVKTLGANVLSTKDFIKKAKKKKSNRHNREEKDIDYVLKKKINDELRRIWLRE